MGFPGVPTPKTPEKSSMVFNNPTERYWYCWTGIRECLVPGRITGRNGQSAHSFRTLRNRWWPMSLWNSPGMRPPLPSKEGSSCLERSDSQIITVGLRLGRPCAATWYDDISIFDRGHWEVLFPYHTLSCRNLISLCAKTRCKGK